MHRVRMFKYFGVTPYLVFDGDMLPSKAKTEASRAKRREESKRIGLELLRAGKPSQAYAELQKAIDVTPEMARHLIEELKKEEVPYVVAPYEADAQLVYLERQGLISGIVSEDSDLLVFGAKRLLTKLDQHGQCVEINRRDFCAVREISLTGWTDSEFRHMAILSGCDYLEGLNNIGLKTAYRLIRKHKTPERVVRMLRFEGKHQVPENYLEDFQQAELTFLYQRVFCPRKQDIVLLTEPGPSVNVDEMPFIGAPIETEMARSIAVGDVNPITRQRIPVPRSPGKRRISQALAPASGPPRSLGKPIDEYFKDKGSRRIPLGEMDPNCFAIDPDHNSNATAADAPRPIVFPLPRPYLDSAEEPASPARPYTNNPRLLRRRSEPISKLLGLDPFGSSGHRRRTTGPVIQVYQDPASSTRPPKKARLCDDATDEEGASATPEKSKFFSATQQRKPAKKKETAQMLMSDDSVEEAFRSLPDFDSWRSEKPVKPSDEIAIFDEGSPEKKSEVVLPAAPLAESDNVEDQVEVPASSPLQHGPAEESQSQGPTAMTPLGELLKGFSYETARPRTRVVHGLPTPASSVHPTATPKNVHPPTTQTPLLTPLQRIGARALHRTTSGPTPTRPRTPVSGLKPKQLSVPSVDPASIPLPKVDMEELEALNRPLGSEDQIVPESDGENEENDDEDDEPKQACSGMRLDLSRFLYS
ncbi:37079799-8999-4fd9-b0ca-c92bfc951371 [Thermothielavioides terrestris]|uniref:37079799-8999-4fd9-b0ca-c92bfc951371 n=1 Tax=Thermothielavioides terrestris TaxID=2587410 RepID=A0A446BQ87_9PEZI|nr:37079799-8999-4fd9-b0ca-c92bfc951371 [Thermothielavioides terrestris]